jgi:hypothetical protein
VIVTIDADDLINRVGSGRTGDGTVLPTEKLLEWAHSADIIPAALTASGAVQDLGRTRRIAGRSPTLALIARDRGCSFPGHAHPHQDCERHPVRIACRRAEEEREDTLFAFERRRSRRVQSAIPASGASHQTQRRPRPETHDQHPHPGRPRRPETRTTESANDSVSCRLREAARCRFEGI